MGIAVGIDLGTTFSAVAWINPATKKPEIVRNSEDKPITPSVIFFEEDGSYICGDEAKEAFERGEYGCASAFKRYMGTNEICCSVYGKNYTAEELSAMLLAHLKKEAEETLNQQITEAVITVPAYFFNDERQATLRAAQKAGLKVRRIINEPTAAALNYGMKHWRENAVIMVYDLGGGTFDVTLVGMGAGYQMESLATVGDHMLGGKDWDKQLVDLVASKIEEETGVAVSRDLEIKNELTSMAEGWKKKLSQPKGTVECSIYVPDYGDVSVTVTRAEFDDATRALLDQTALLCEQVLEKKGVSWQQVTDVLLVGGSTRMPQVSEFLTKLTGKQPIAHVNPDEAVALGAAMQTMLQDEEYVVYSVPAKKAAADAPASKGLFSFMKKEPPKPAAVSQGTTNDIVLKYSKPVKQAETLADVALIGKRDVQAHGMGIISVNPEGTAYINENIIPPNMPIPVKSARAFQFHTTARGDNELEIFVLEGEGKPLECDINAKYVVSGIRHIKGSPTTIRVQYSFDRNSIIHVQVRQENDQRDLPIKKVPIDPDEMYKYGKPIDPNDFKAQSDLTIVMAVDVSGSMMGSPLADAKSAMISFVKQYEDTGAYIGVMVVSDRVAWVCKPTSNYSQCIQAINSITVGMTGGCNAAHPFADIENYFRSEDGNQYAIILADGMWENQNRAITAAKSCHRAGIEIAAIGFGSADKEFLNAVSSQQDLSILTQQSELTKSFGKIAQSIGTGSGKKGQHGANNITDTWETND